MRLICLLLFLSAPLHCFNLNPHKQMLLVLTDDWGEREGSLYLFKRQNSNSEWLQDRQRFTVRLARNGLAWGRGLHPRKNLEGPQKREADDCSPSGIFSIGPVFGVGAKDQINPLKMPYIHLTPSLIGVNDIKSSHYNQIVNRDAIKADWTTFHVLSDLKGCEWGAIIEYNLHPAIAMEGSLAFIFQETDQPLNRDLPCTALKQDDLLSVLYWLEQSNKPILVQLTKQNYLKYKKAWQLPEIEWSK